MSPGRADSRLRLPLCAWKREVVMRLSLGRHDHTLHLEVEGWYPLEA